MGASFVLLKKCDIEYGNILPYRSFNMEQMENFIDKLRNLGIVLWEAESYEDCWQIAIEIEKDSFLKFYREHIKNSNFKKELKLSNEDIIFNECELKSIQEIKKLIDEKPNYIEKCGFVRIAYV